jgi:hypothetical protein
MPHHILALLGGCTAALALFGCASDDSGPGQSADTSVDVTIDLEDDAPADVSRDAPGDVPPDGLGCANPDPSWLFCEDFESGAGDFDAWFAASGFVEALGGGDRGRIRLDGEQPHGGEWAVYYPAAADSGFEGADLIWYDCEGEQTTNCPLVNHDRLYFRTWLRLAEDHRYVHHFLAIDGSQPDDFWYHGTAGCLPDGELSMGTTLDLREDSHETFFYTYFPDMACDANCERYADVDAVCTGCAERGLPTCDVQPQCCWGNDFHPEPAVALPIDEWVCVVLMLAANTPGQPDGEMAYWVDGVPAHAVSGLAFRTTSDLGLNRVRLEHYITTSDAGGHSNRIWFDDVVVSTAPIGCE